LLVLDILQFIVLAFSGFGNVFAGIILFKVQKWNSFQNISGLLILVQPLMGLKGNLEMTMASRLSTLANVGNHMDSWLNILDLIRADMILVQFEATVVSLFAALVAIISVLISGTPISFNNAILLCAISLTTANISCFLLGKCQSTYLEISVLH
jgi:solute carrier family 41